MATPGGHTIRSFLAGLLTLCGAGCSSLLVADESTVTSSYFPMEANRQWRYVLREIEGKRVWPVAVRSRGPRFVPELGRIVSIFDEEYPDQVVPVAFFLEKGFLHSEIGLGYGFGDRSMTVLPIGTQPMRLMPFPPRIGMRWSYSENVFAPANQLPTALVIRWQGEIEARESVEVPAGVFRDCLRVTSVAVHETGGRGAPPEYQYVDWYAPDVGLVKSEYSSGERARTLTRLELVDLSFEVDSPEPGPPHLRRAGVGAGGVALR